ncbi:EamA family transporter RarD [Notoacmeibacter sp. MSK16QG-6]|uniref:EamA family transporter RarD n=1 Tax=Notoacmeibacter sp. MSK16QG-6 TaxID=2957982 RepID=UPI0020A16B42|nr:EamA family transporter RarD [Notoacmeibacter sp. MSK16QG-6]MCP1198012.1 EamA family transporter RarD [Notoacmeibacter sp. MSK16QG-6]
MATSANGPVVTDTGDTLTGFFYAFSAYLLWGFLPFYMKAVAHIGSIEVVAHRVLWSIPLAGAWILWLRRTDDLKRALGDWRIIGMAAVTATLISINWSIYVWAIANDRALETSLGYYVNPLFTVALGAIVLREKMTRLQLAAIVSAVIAVAILTWESGGLPLVSLGLVLSWGGYAYFRKTLPVGPNQGFFLEVLLLAPVAFGYLLWLTWSDNKPFFGGGGWEDVGLLLFAGVATAIPLILYANGAKLLRLSTIGVMQYIAPTMIFLIAVFVFKEPFGPARLVAFCFIWLALALYVTSILRERRRQRANLPLVEPGTRT